MGELEVSKPRESRACVRRLLPALAAVVLAIALVLVVGLVPAEAETVAPATDAPATDAPAADITVASGKGPIRTHTNQDLAGATAPFSITCADCHAMHEASEAKLLKTSAQGLCGSCHDLAGIHADPATQGAVSALAQPVDCVSCHPHSSGFMPVSDGIAPTLSKQMTGYDDLDSDSAISPGDRIHYRIDYTNPGLYGLTGVVLSDQPDTAYVTSVDAITGGGTFDGASIQWSIGTLEAGATGYATYDVLFQDAAAFRAAATTTTSTLAPVIDTTTTTLPAFPTGSTESTATTTTSTSAPVIESTTTTLPAFPTGSTESSTTTTLPTAESTPTTAAAASGTGSSVDVVNTATLTADIRDPVSTSVTVTVQVEGAGLSATTLTDSTTTTTDSIATTTEHR